MSSETRTYPDGVKEHAFWMRFAATLCSIKR